MEGQPQQRLTRSFLPQKSLRLKQDVRPCEARARKRVGRSEKDLREARAPISTLPTSRRSLTSHLNLKEVNLLSWP